MHEKKKLKKKVYNTLDEISSRTSLNKSTNDVSCGRSIIINNIPDTIHTTVLGNHTRHIIFTIHKKNRTTLNKESVNNIKEKTNKKESYKKKFRKKIKILSLNLS